jgi:dCTP deaminase
MACDCVLAQKAGIKGAGGAGVNRQSRGSAHCRQTSGRSSTKEGGMSHRSGVLPCQSIERLIAEGAIGAQGGIAPDQVQPASLDLRLGRRAWRVRASFLPRPGDTIARRIGDVAMHELDLSGGAVLERGCVYICELAEYLALPPGLRARANPKSSTGRLDVFVRLLSDGQGAFDDVAEAYRGPLYLEVAPQTFSVLARTGTRLNQIRFRRGPAEALSVVDVGVDLSGGVAAYRARRHAGVIDLDLEMAHDPADFWEPLRARRGELLLDPGEFYVLASQGRIESPSHQAAEMIPIDPAVGEFRVHYAGFFDPGFGIDVPGGEGSRGVLEVRSHETPFLLENGQTVARLVFAPLTEPPARIYGSGGAHYQRQGLTLSKHFSQWRERGS